MAAGECPIPNVGQALSPYIKTRDEATAIRQALQRYLESQLSTNGSALSSLTLPQKSAIPLDSPPPALSGVRKAYWKALQAHTAAQTRYDALRAELEQFKHGKPEPVVNGAGSAASINETYIPLLRQKEKQRKLKAIEKAYASVSAAGDGLSAASVDDIVKRQIGEPPAPPSAPPSSTQNAEGEALMLDLKKSLISTKGSIDERKKRLASYQRDSVSLSPQAHIAGLQAALQELTIWMDSQLSTIADVEPEVPPSDGPENKSNPFATKPSTSVENIESLYEAYLSARKQLIQAVKPPPSPDSPHKNLADILGHPSSTNYKDPARPSPSSATKTSAEILLPHLPTLLASKRHEQSLLQLTAYTRGQLSSAENRTEQLIRRLAGESHLVQPGAARGDDWAAAARDTEKATEKVVRERVEAGERWAEAASKTMGRIHGLAGSVDRVIDG